MNRRTLGAPLLLLVGLALAVGGAVVGAGTAGAARAGGISVTSTPYYLALGGSGSVGVQPTLAHPHGQATDDGYSNDLAVRMASRWPGLALVRIGCPGSTTQTMIGGGGRCAYEAGSQLQTALAFLRTHPSTVLVTVDLGFNDLVPCMRHMEINGGCVSGALAAIADQLPQILVALRQAAPAATHILGVGHYDPYLGYETHGSAGIAFADASVEVIDRLNDVLRAAYDHAGMLMADVSGAFDLRNSTVLNARGLGTVPTNVARVCSLTWMCSSPPLGPNTHPNDYGYRVESDALAAALSSIMSR